MANGETSAHPIRSGAAAQAVREAADQLAKDAVDRAKKVRIQKLLAILAAIQPSAPGYGPAYEINRAGGRGRITADDILRARTAIREQATLADCLDALEPLVRLPGDYMVQDKTQDLYRFPDGTGRTVGITSEQLEAAKRIWEEAGRR